MRKIKYNKEQIIAQKEGATLFLIHCFDEKSEEFFKKMKVSNISFKNFNKTRAEFNYKGFMGCSVFSKGLALVPGEEFEANCLINLDKDNIDTHSFNKIHSEMLDLFDLKYEPSSDYNPRMIYSRGDEQFSMGQLSHKESSFTYKQYLINMTKDIIINKGVCSKIVIKQLKDLTVDNIVSLGTPIDYDKYPALDETTVNEYQYINSFKDWYVLQYGEYNPETYIYLYSYKSA